MSLKKWALAGAIGYAGTKYLAGKINPPKERREPDDASAAECSQCGGTGKKDGSNCKACDGEG